MLIRSLLVGLAAGVLTAWLMAAGALERTDLAVLDRLFALRGPRVPAGPIVIVAIDEDSFDELDLAWPFPRALHGVLLDQIAAAGAAAIGLDLLFPEPSSRGPEDDAALGVSVARAGNVVLGAAITTVAESFYVKVDLNAPIPAIRAGAAGVGPVNHATDRDGGVRRTRLRHALGGEALDGWDLQLYRVAHGAGVPAAPPPALEEFVINYRGGPGTFVRVPYHRAVRGEVDPALFRGAIVLVGATTPTLQDVYSTPFAEARTMPGVEVHANVLDSLVRGDAIRAAPAWMAPPVALAVALAAAWLVVRLRAIRGFLAAVLLAVGVVAATLVAFAAAHVWFPAAGVVLALVLGYGATVVDSYVREQRERRRLAQFFSPAVLREIVRQPSRTALGSRRRVVTVLFSDLRGFTALSERLEPEVVAGMLGEYLTEMTEVVFRHGGTVDKYVGDCIMALYNAPFDDPDHATNAVRTALELQERTLAVARRWEARLGVALRNGVGIHTGEAVVGTLGSRQRLEYTAIGDTVNLASRLESLTKDYGASVIVSEDTWALIRDRFPTRRLGEVTVKGKSRPVRIFTVLPADIRRHPRAALDAAATVTAVGAGGPVVVRTRDVSPGGLCVVGLPDGWGPGTSLEIRLEGGFLDGALAVGGTVVWRHADAAGVAFAGADPALAPAVEGGVAETAGT
jgi:adenylate cyclase